MIACRSPKGEANNTTEDNSADVPTAQTGQGFVHQYPCVCHNDNTTTSWMTVLVS